MLSAIQALSLISLFFGALPAGLAAAQSDFYQVKIGVSSPLTGDLAEYGAAVRNGIELARAEGPENFRNLTFLYEDNRYEPVKAITAIERLHLAGSDLIYNWGEPTLHAIAPIAEKIGLPILAMSLDPAPALGRRFIVRSINYSEQYALALLNYLRLKHVHRLAIIKTEDPFINSMIDGLRKNLSREESLEVLYSFIAGETDFKSAVTRIKSKSANYDALGVYLFSGQVSSFYRQAGALNLNMPTFGTDFFESRTEIKNAQGFMNRAVYPNIDVPDDFSDKYFLAYGNDIQIAYAYNAFVFARVAADLYGGLQAKPAPAEIIECLSRVEGEKYGFRFKNSAQGGRYFEFPMVIKRIDGSKIRKVN